MKSRKIQKNKLTIEIEKIIMQIYQVCNCTAGINLTWTLFQMFMGVSVFFSAFSKEDTRV